MLPWEAIYESGMFLIEKLIDFFNELHKLFWDLDV
jgi:hypothetical protein